MIRVRLKILVFLLSTAYSPLYCQEKTTSTTPPVALAQKFEAEYEKNVNAKALTFANSLGKNPLYFLDVVSSFYTQTCHSPQNRTLYAYAKSPILNFRKCLAYFNLSRSVNARVFSPYVEEIIAKMSTTLDPSQFGTQTLQDAHMEHLATLADHPILNQRAERLFKQEWEFESVQMDLESEETKLTSLQSKFDAEKEKLLLVEQTDGALVKINASLKKSINSLNRASQIISKRDALKKIIGNPYEFIFKCITNNCLEQELKKVKNVFSIDNLNEFYKSQHAQGNGLLHEICLDKQLSLAQKQSTIQFLENHGIHLNEHNAQRMTALDLVKNIPALSPLYQLLIDMGGQHSLPAVITLKKSFDTPPPSPDVVFEVKLKRTVSFQQDKTN